MTPGITWAYYTCQPGLRIADPGWLESPSTRVHVNIVNIVKKVTTCDVLTRVENQPGLV